MIVAALKKLEAGSLLATPQPPEGVTYATKLAKEEGRVNWRRPAVALDRQLRALTPWPGMWFEWKGERIKLLAATPVGGSGEPGTVLDDSLTIACGEGALRIDRLQRAGKAPLDAGEFLRGFVFPAGTRLDLP